MNVDGRMDYVSYKNYSTFEGDKNNQEFLSNLPENLKGMDARKWVFKPGNPIANFLACTRKMSLKIGDSLFVHAGILPEISQKYKIVHSKVYEIAKNLFVYNSFTIFTSVINSLCAFFYNY